ncbi:hypothetical protein Pla108_14240 [Botrimarina colliarenosi]|uniref:DUF2726 domain-containing protein n=1 Tax=Botrimarina colliarenosi TaxID=2528001 RepID=A0A5C6AKB0_9BACT|nr:DUF2726 domain-containing protein [Botrimarina colliarenosi]TWU00473.1 hypothetical protein Pla108_14240 [Botrimarina colliarenosi]
MTSTKERPLFATNAQPSGRHGDLPYRSCDKLLSEGELRFYRQGLRPAIGKRYVIAPKVRLTDVITVHAEAWGAASGRKIRQRHVDFALATRRDLSIVAVVELDDASHLDPARRVKDDYLGDALHAAGVPLVRFPVYQRYDPERIRRIIDRVLRDWRSAR